MKHPGDDAETLYINRFDSRCGNCGKGAVPDQVVHDVAYGYKQSEGCGVTFKCVSSNYAGMRALTELRRPDLEWKGWDE